MVSALPLQNSQPSAEQHGALPLPTLDQVGPESQLNIALAKSIQLQMTLFNQGYNKIVFDRYKAICDKIVVALALVALAPLFVLIATLIKVTSRGPILYKQIRLGKGMAPFYIYKFRTMYKNADQIKLQAQNEMIGPMFKMRHDPRVTPMGCFLRRWSLDELPQLLNILLGDMSLVGPRPLHLIENNFISDKYLMRFSIKPGLTGLWQATIRDSHDSQLKLALDAQYATERCWTLDVKILFKTIWVVISGKGAY